MTVVTLSLLVAAVAVTPGEQNGTTNHGDSTRVAPAARAQVRAVRLPSPVEVDGALSDAVWRSATRISGFVQRDPDEGKPATESTVVWVAFDDGAIYVAARLYDSQPSEIVQRLGRRDDYTGGDRFTFYVDPYHDRRSGFWFSVDAAGTLGDGTLYNDDWDSDNWDGVWEGKSAVDSLGWTVEMRIPYSQLRFAKAASYTWGVNFRRELTRRSEYSYYVLRPKNSSGFVSRFADLSGIEQITPPRRLEIMPYITSKADFVPVNRGDPFRDGSELAPGLGGDARVGLGSNFTATFTFNPDFGQVEVDPAVVNLSDVESTFDEKRPFFVDGSSTFEFGYGGQRNFWGFNWRTPSFFYSRRVGRGLRVSAPDGGYADGPSAAHILGAMKLTGKFAGSWNVGALSAVTGREQAQMATFTVDSTTTPGVHDTTYARWTQEIEPLTFYGVYRAQKEFPEGRQGLGFLTTIAARSFDDPQLRDDRNANSTAVGADGWVFLDRSKTWVTTAWVGVSRVAGTPARMLAVQQHSSHYFQQPDADHVSVDSNATSMTGMAVRWTLAKQKGATFVNGAVGVISPGFDLNDLGFLPRTGIINAHFGGGRTWTKAGKVFRYREVLGAIFGVNDWGGNANGRGIWGSTYMQFKSYWWTNLNLAYNPQTLSKDRTRGGPLTVNNPGFEINFNLGSNDRRKFYWSMYEGMYYQSAEQYDWWGGMSFSFRPASNINLSISPNLSGGKTPAQYITSFDDASATATYGRRYIFAQLDRTELSAGVRMNWTFTPVLSLQLYMQPLISAGDYSDYKSLRAPRTYDFDPYSTTSEDDFNFRSLRGNAVLRWEYLPGSTLFLVWAHGRTDSDDTGTFRFRHSMDRMFAHQPDNLFMVKVSYYWNP